MGLVSGMKMSSPTEHTGGRIKKKDMLQSSVQAALSTTVVKTPNSSHLCIRDVNTSQSNATYDTISLFSLLSSLRSLCYILTLNCKHKYSRWAFITWRGGNELTMAVKHVRNVTNMLHFNSQIYYGIEFCLLSLSYKNVEFCLLLLLLLLKKEK